MILDTPSSLVRHPRPLESGVAYYYSAAWSWPTRSARGQLVDFDASCDERRERSLSMTFPRQSVSSLVVGDPIRRPPV